MAKSFLDRFREPTNEEWQAALDKVSEHQTTRIRPPHSYGTFRGHLATKLEWKLVGRVWRRYWPDGCEQPVSIGAGIHKCRKPKEYHA